MPPLDVNKYKLPPLNQNLDKFKLATPTTTTPTPNPGFVNTTDIATGKPSQAINWSNPLPALKSIGSRVRNFLTGSEQGFGKEAAAAIGAPGAQKQADTLNLQHQNTITQAIKLSQQLKAAGKDTSKVDALINSLKSEPLHTVGDVLPAVNDTNGQVLGNAAGVAGDVLGAGTYGKAAKGLEAGKLGIAAAPTAITAAKAGTKIAQQATDNAVASSVAKGAQKTGDKVVELVSPRLTPTVAASTKATAPTGVLGKISAVASDRTKQVAEAVKDVVNPAKTFTENANNVEKGINTEAEALKAAVKGADHPYTYKELTSTLKGIDIPEFIKTSDATVQNRASRIISKFSEIAKTHEGTISGLLDTRKEFDQWVKKEYPRVFDAQGDALSTLVKNVRTSANNFMAENVPSVAFKQSLKKQNLMYDALDVLREKAAKGAPKSVGEIGTTRVSRFAKAHPVITQIGKYAAGSAIGTTALGGAAEGIKNLGL